MQIYYDNYKKKKEEHIYKTLQNYVKKNNANTHKYSKKLTMQNFISTLKIFSLNSFDLFFKNMELMIG